MDESHTRRTVLKATGALGGAAAVGSLSGCISLSSGDDSIDYTNWLYAPGAIGDDHSEFRVTDHQSIRDNEDVFPDANYDQAADTVDEFPLNQMGVDYEDVNTTIDTYPGQVVFGSFSEEDVIAELEDNEFTEKNDHEGYTIYTKGGESAEGNRSSGEDIAGNRPAIAVNDSVVAASRVTFGDDDYDPQNVVETLIDTEEGTENRSVDENEDMSVLIDELGEGTSIVGGTTDEIAETDPERGQFAGMVASGTRTTLNGETTERTVVYVFSDSDDVDTDAIEEWTETDIAEPAIGDFDDVSISESGRTAVVTGETDTDEFLGTDSDSDSTPNPTFESDYNQPEQTLELEMTGGDTFIASRATVKGDTAEANETWATLQGVSPDAEVTAGDSITLTEVPTDFEVDLVWVSEDGATSTTLFARTGPDA